MEHHGLGGSDGYRNRTVPKILSNVIGIGIPKLRKKKTESVFFGILPIPKIPIPFYDIPVFVFRPVRTPPHGI